MGRHGGGMKAEQVAGAPLVYRDPSVRVCPTCGKLVRLTRQGGLRRHFVTRPRGEYRLCLASGRSPDEVRA
jgi:hypothetical protein